MRRGLILLPLALLACTVLTAPLTLAVTPSAGAVVTLTATPTRAQVSSPASSATPLERAKVCGCVNLNIRQGSSAESGVIGGLAAGDVVEVIERVPGWARLAGGGWVSEKYLCGG